MTLDGIAQSKIDAPVKSQPQMENSDTEDDLQAVRRIDWRFLLSDPALEHVGYVGSKRGTLWDALNRFGDMVTALDSVSAPQGTDTPFDVVVVETPTAEAVARACESVRPGGTLYFECSGWLMHPYRVTSVVRRRGFSSVRVYWHWPNFEAATRLIALEDVGPVLQAIVKKQSGIKATLIAAAVRWLHHTGALGWAVQHFSVVAER